MLEKLEVKGIEDITLEHLVVLRGLITAIKEGDTTPDQAFGASHKKEEPKKTEALPPLPDDKFKADLPKWKEAMRTRGLTPQQIITNLSTKHALTDDQKFAIDDLAEQIKHEGEQQ